MTAFRAAVARRLDQRRRLAYLRRVHAARPEPGAAFALAHALKRWPA